MKKFRLYTASPYSKAEYIVGSKHEAQDLLPKDKATIVKVCDGRRVLDTYLVSWMGDYFKWDPCCCESDR